MTAQEGLLKQANCNPISTVWLFSILAYLEFHQNEPVSKRHCFWCVLWQANWKQEVAVPSSAGIAPFWCRQTHAILGLSIIKSYVWFFSCIYCWVVLGCCACDSCSHSCSEQGICRFAFNLPWCRLNLAFLIPLLHTVYSSNGWESHARIRVSML